MIAITLLILFYCFIFAFIYGAGKMNKFYDKKVEEMLEANKGKTVFETLPELNQIARELGVNVNNWKVIEEYFNRHPEERSQQELKSNKTLKK